MVFSPTPPRNNAPSQLLPLNAIVNIARGNSGSSGSVGTITISTSPAMGNVGAALAVAGTVSPSGSGVRVGLSGSITTPPTSWTAAGVNGNGWTASVSASAAGIYYVWAEQANTPAVQATSTAVTISSVTSGSVTFSSAPTSGTPGVPLALSGSVSPSGSAVQVGLSTSATVGPASWSSATVSGTSWTAAVTPAAAGTYYLWVEQTNTPSVQAVSPAVTVASSSSALNYSLITGSGNGSLTGTTLTTGSAYTVDWSSVIAPGATDVVPNVTPSAMGSIAGCKFWFDSSSTNTTVPSSYGNAASFNNGEITFYSNATFSTPTGIPGAPTTAGTYYGKYAMYNSAGTLLGVFVTSGITIT